MTKAELKEKLTNTAIMLQRGMLFIEEAEKIMNRTVEEYRIETADYNKQIERDKQANRMKWKLLLKATAEHSVIRRETKKE